MFFYSYGVFIISTPQRPAADGRRGKTLEEGSERGNICELLRPLFHVHVHNSIRPPGSSFLLGNSETTGTGDHHIRPCSFLPGERQREPFRAMSILPQAELDRADHSHSESHLVVGIPNEQEQSRRLMKFTSIKVSAGLHRWPRRFERAQVCDELVHFWGK